MSISLRGSSYNRVSTKGTVSGRFARRVVSANHWSKGIETHRFLWLLTLVSPNHASSNSGQFANNLSRFANVFDCFANFQLAHNRSRFANFAICWPFETQLK